MDWIMDLILLAIIALIYQIWKREKARNIYSKATKRGNSNE